jgi:hypothetical protein
MNKEKMNCKCLDSIIENDQRKHTVEHEWWDGVKVYETAKLSKIVFNCLTTYRKKVVNKLGIIKTDRLEDVSYGIPLLYCPICGTRSLNNL